MNKDFMWGALLGAMAARGGARRDQELADKKAKVQEAAVFERRRRLELENTMPQTDLHPIIKWGARLVYAAGTAGIAFVLIRGFVFHNWS